MLELSESLLAQIKTHGAQTYPYEGCGLLLGRMENGRNIVTAVRPMANVWPDQEEQRVRFRIAEEDWYKVEMDAMMGRGPDIVGIFHSHPDSEPDASPRDLAWANFSGYSYLITKVAQGQPAHSRSWQLLPDRSGFVEEEIHIRQ